MTDRLQTKRTIAVCTLVSAAIALLSVLYFQPIWWVSLTAPNYPVESFPDGVRIHFHMNGVFNGCTLKQKAEIEEIKALDCVHEMDAINHFVGMYPIASGGVIEKHFSPLLVSMVAVTLLGFMIPSRAIRVLVMSLGFAGIAAWMYLTYYGSDGARLQNAGYLGAMVTSLGQGEEEEGGEISPIIAKLREALVASGAGSTTDRKALTRQLQEAGQKRLSDIISRLHEGAGSDSGKTLKQILEEARKNDLTGKDLSLSILESTFAADQSRQPADKRTAWTGSGRQLLLWHYEKALGRWFNNPAEIGPLVKATTVAADTVFWGIVVVMLVMLFAASRELGILHWLLVLAPAALPLIFLIEYSAWLWWYGHSLNEMGAFTLKPFMPTVFGQGKVAQFTTHSYPHYGFGLMLLFSACLLLAALIRRKAQKDAGASAS